MFYSIKGTLTHMEPGFVVVECAGVGFKCLTTLSTQRTMPQIGEQVKLFTHLNVREDAMDLFGFATMMELNCFKMLTAVSGVGPKVGLAILSELSPEQVAMAAAVSYTHLDVYKRQSETCAYWRRSGVEPWYMKGSEEYGFIGGDCRTAFGMVWTQRPFPAVEGGTGALPRLGL